MWENFGINHWFWASIAVILSIMEIFVPGVYFIWLGGAALVTALMVGMVGDISWYWQFSFFSALAIASVYVGRQIYRKTETVSDDLHLNKRGARMIGQVYTLIEPIENGSGRVQIGDSPWLVHGPSGLDKGRKVRVVAVHGSALQVEAADY
jgi:membrane protein implicated in regulation of membrane protease activity